MSDGGRPAVFLDRDGTVVVEADYLADPEGVELVPGAASAIRRLRDAGYVVVVVTNQSGIARGLYSLEDYHAVAGRIDALLEAQGARPDATYFCPHHPDFTGPCECRKPGPGMYLQARDELGLDLALSFFVGDKLTDVLPARHLGGEGLLVRTGYGADWEDEVPPDVVVVDDLVKAVEWIVAVTSGREGSRASAGEPKAVDPHRGQG